MARNIKWKIRAFQEIRRLPKVDAMLQDVVDEIMDGLPEGYIGTVSAGRTRSRGSVVTAEWEAIMDNEANNSLLRELAKVRVD